MSARLFIGDVHEVLASMPEASVDLVVTSPPFLALRSYLPAEHPDKDKEIGSEPSPGAFIDALLDVTEALARVLTPHGSICVELGDTYSGSGGAGGDYNQGGWREGEQPFAGSMKHARIHDPSKGPPIQNKNGKTQGGGKGWPEAKSLCLIPELYRFALAYGFNPLTGRTTPPWRVRNVVRWHRPNPPVGALGDKFRPATSDMVVACKARDRYFDLDAVRTAAQQPDPAGDRSDRRTRIELSAEGKGDPGHHGAHPAGAPPLDTWIIPTAPFKGSHYATFPPDLVVRPIKSMCPEWVCVTCGEPRRRIVGDAEYVPSASYRGGVARADAERVADGVNQWKAGDAGQASVVRTAPTLGWTDCGHDDYRRGVVLDPFAGSGTTLSVATGQGRDAIGIDIDERNADLCRERIGMFLEVLEAP